MMLNKALLLVVFLISTGCTKSNPAQISQKQQLESYIGQLAIENTKTLTYQTTGISTHGSKFSAHFADLFVKKVQYLDEEYRADYLVTGLWMIPLEGGLINEFADTVAIKDCANPYLFDKLEHFLADKEFGHQYQKGQYARVADVYTTILITCKIST